MPPVSAANRNEPPAGRMTGGFFVGLGGRHPSV